MEQLIPIINKLQDVFGAIGHHPIDLPQIVVVGSQSSGKSSVLESIVGRDFLPRNAGICTRRPLILQLYTLPRGHTAEPSREEWGEFLHLPGQKFYDFSEIRAEIQRETDRITGKNKGISHKSINLRIFSPHVLNLTLVDLPGVTKVPTGDQPEDVEMQIKNMCLEFITNPNAIILAVSAANQDLVNSDGLQMARSVDPDGERTIGVLTKVDIMDLGTDCTDILLNKVIPLKKGYIAVVNRSQKDIIDNTPIRIGLQREQQYFQNHPKYRTVITKTGTANLARMLNQILMHHIKQCLPEIKGRIASMLAEVQQTMDSLGESIENQGESRLGGILLKILSNFAASIANAVKCNGFNDSSVVMTELFGGARINYVFNEVFGKRLRQLDAMDGLSDEQIRTVVANANGPRQALLVSVDAFDTLVRTQIARLQHPGLQCLDYIYEEMLRIIAHAANDGEFHRFPYLKDKLLDIVNQLLRSYLQPTHKMVVSLIQTELAYINVSHPDFIGCRQALGLAQKNRTKLQGLQSVGPNPPNAVTTSPEGVTVVPNLGGEASENISTSDSIGTQQPQASNSGNSTIPRNPSKIAVMSNPSTSGSGVQGSNIPPNGNNSGFLGLFRPVNSNGVPLPPANFSPMQQPSVKSQNVNLTAPPNQTQMVPQNMADMPPPPSKSVNDLVMLPPVPDVMRCGNNPSERELLETDTIKILITSYFDIVKKNFMDLVPKTIMNFLVNSFQENLQNELVSQLYKGNFINELMRETDDIAIKRKTCKEMKELLGRALEIVNEVRDFNSLK